MKTFAIEIADIKIKELKQNLKKGDTIKEEVSPGGKVIRTSKRVGDARIAFFNLIKGLIESGSITPKEATEATQYFGKKTSSIFWVK